MGQVWDRETWDRDSTQRDRTERGVKDGTEIDREMGQRQRWESWD